MKKYKDKRDSLIQQQHSQERSWKNKIEKMRATHLRQLEEVLEKVERQEKDSMDQKVQYCEIKKRQASKGNKNDATAHKQEVIWGEEENDRLGQRKEEEKPKTARQVDQNQIRAIHVEKQSCFSQPKRPERTRTRRCKPPPTLLMLTEEHDAGSETKGTKDSDIGLYSRIP